MTIIEFQLDEESLKQDLNHSPEKTNPAALEQTYFMMPVRFCANRVELLGQQNASQTKVFIPHPEHGLRETYIMNEPSRWCVLPLLGFATHGLQALSEIGENAMRKVSIADGCLIISRRGQKIHMVSDANGRTVMTEYVEVWNAFEEFSEKVRQMLISRVPALQQHPSWRQWFPPAA